MGTNESDRVIFFLKVINKSYQGINKANNWPRFATPSSPGMDGFQFTPPRAQHGERRGRGLEWRCFELGRGDKIPQELRLAKGFWAPLARAIYTARTAALTVGEEIRDGEEEADFLFFIFEIGRAHV